LRHGMWFFEEFIRYQQELASQSVASHGQPWYYHPLVLLIGAFPASVLALRAFGENLTWNAEQKNFRTWMAVLFWVVLILFSMVKTKIIHYSSLCYLPLTFLAALVMESCRVQRIQYRRSNAVFVGLIGFTVAIAFFALPLLLGTSLKAGFIASLRDPFAAANLNQTILWPWYTYSAGAVMFIIIALSVYWLWKRELEKAFPTLFGGTLIALQLFLLLGVPRLEKYTQAPAIEFLENIQTDDAYVETLGYKSYAQYFYGRIQPVGDTLSLRIYSDTTRYRYEGQASRDIPNQQFKNWLIHGKIDKPAYFISKIQAREDFEAQENLEVIGEKGGFVFYKRIN